MSFFDTLKNILLLLIIIQIAPPIIMNIKKMYTHFKDQPARVGVIQIRGVLYDSDTYNKQLNTFFKDPSIKAILLKMECPGGAAGTAQAIFNEIQMLKKDHPKTIITLVENTCASGGYYIACATDAIIAPPSALIGSIGTTIPYLFNLKEFVEQYKIYPEVFKAGSYKSATNPFAPMTDKEKAMVQGILEDSYQQFANDVAKARAIPINTITTWADGKLFTGQQALQLKLIDAIGSAINAVNWLKEKAIIETDIEWVHAKKPGALSSIFGGEQEDDSDSMFTQMVTKFMTLVEDRYAIQRLY